MRLDQLLIKSKKYNKGFRKASSSLVNTFSKDGQEISDESRENLEEFITGLLSMGATLSRRAHLIDGIAIGVVGTLGIIGVSKLINRVQDDKEED